METKQEKAPEKGKKTAEKPAEEHSEKKVKPTGNPREDYQAFLKTRDFDLGLSLVLNHTGNARLKKLLIRKGKTPQTQAILEKNLKIISRKWKNK